MRVVYSPHSGVEISGSAHELTQLAELLRTARGERMWVEVSDPTPYDTSLGCVVAAGSTGSGAARMTVSGRELIISGTQADLQILADNIANAALSPGEHLHIEPIDTPGYYIAADSEPAVVICTDSAG